jgi:integrase
MNIHVFPEFGNMPIEAITSLDIEKFIRKLKCKSSKTKQNILTPLRIVMRFAKKHKFIQVNPFLDVDPIKKTKGPEARALSLGEIKKFIDALDAFWKPVFIVTFFTGIRIAEASGLKWKHVDFDKGVIKIRKNLVRGHGGKIIYKKPKTESSIRDVVLPPFVIEALHEQHTRTFRGSGDNFVFLNKAGRPLNRHTLNHSVIKPTLEKIGVDTHISIKDTRASFITNSLDKKERLGFIQRQVGHTTPRMIIEHYYREILAPDDGMHMEEAWNSTSILPETGPTVFEVAENTKK